MDKLQIVNERIKLWTRNLQESGYKITKPREAVIQILAEAEKSLNPNEIHELALQRYPKLGLVTVYRTLEKLEALNLIVRVHCEDNCYSFTAGFDGHQHILLCERCGRVVHFSGDDISSLVNKVESDSGFIVQDHLLQLFGICESCQKKSE